MSKTSVFYVMLLAFAAALYIASPARADEQPHLLSVHQKWSAYSFSENGKKVCYIAGLPTKSEGATDKMHRGEIFALITDRPSEGSKNVFSYITGYAYKPGSGVTVTIDKQHFTLFTQDDTAWAPDGATDNKISAAIRKGTNMVVKGTSAKGTTTTDTFLLAGAGGAYDVITKACNGDGKAAH